MPHSISLRRVGSVLSSAQGVMKSSVAPSKSMSKTRYFLLPESRRDVRPYRHLKCVLYRIFRLLTPPFPIKTFPIGQG